MSVQRTAVFVVLAALAASAVAWLLRCAPSPESAPPARSYGGEDRGPDGSSAEVLHEGTRALVEGGLEDEAFDVELAPTANPDRASPIGWRPAPDSPIALLGDDVDLGMFEPTLESMSTQILQVPKYASLSDERLRRAWETPGFQEAWKRNREALALRMFVASYTRREYERWRDAKASVALETELGPVVGFLAELPDPDAVWRALSAYSNEVIDALREHGESTPAKDDVPSKWALFGLLTEQSAGATAFVESVLDAGG